MPRHKRTQHLPYTTLFRSLRHPHALQWGEHDYGRAHDDAEKARYAVHGDACDLRSITGRRGRSPFGPATEPEVEPAMLSRRPSRSEEHTSELQSPCNLVCR